jgi:hypothetical protein
MDGITQDPNTQISIIQHTVNEVRLMKRDIWMQTKNPDVSQTTDAEHAFIYTE